MTSWEQALTRLRECRQARLLSPNTIKLEQGLIRRASRRLAATPAEVTPTALRDYLAARQDEVSPSTMALEVAALRTLFVLLIDEGHVDADPTEGLTVKVPERQQLVLSELDMQAMLEAASTPVIARRAWEINEAVALRNRAALEILYGAGVRATELCQALVTDLDLQAPSLFVRRVKRGPHESLPLPLASREHLHTYLQRARPVLLRLRDESQGALLVNERGRPLTGNHLLRLVVHMADRAGVRASPHAIRRTVATGLVRSGASLPVVQALLGHKRLDTTQRYVSVDLEDLRASIATLSLL